MMWAINELYNDYKAIPIVSFPDSGCKEVFVTKHYLSYNECLVYFVVFYNRDNTCQRLNLSSVLKKKKNNTDMPLPDLGLRGGIVYLMLVLAIPIQYYISNTIYVPSGQRDASLKRFINSLSNFHYNYLSISSWHRWCSNVLKKVDGWRTAQHTFFTFDDEETGESPAIEVIQYKHPQGHFATSTNIRSPRPSEVKFRVGQVVRHKIWGYRGVIVGWDPIAKAPEEWLDKMHPPDKWHWRKMPNYSILVDTRDRPDPQMTYVPEENLEVITDTEIKHPNVQNYFDSFNGVQKYLKMNSFKYFSVISFISILNKPSFHYYTIF
ncbi:hypothetical protein Btru_033925 [Bulinus truncatus]|nr:hypothetical protein Btru_033925 [Bulinus truncatus]